MPKLGPWRPREGVEVSIPSPCAGSGVLGMIWYPAAGTPRGTTLLPTMAPSDAPTGPCSLSSGTGVPFEEGVSVCIRLQGGPLDPASRLSVMG